MNTDNTKPLLLWDGECGFCARITRWWEAKNVHAGSPIRLIPYQHAPTPPMTPELYAACAKAIHLVLPDGKIIRGGRAALFVMDKVGYGWFAKPLGLVPFVWFVDMGYKIVAANRDFFSRLIFPKQEVRCALPARKDG